MPPKKLKHARSNSIGDLHLGANSPISSPVPQSSTQGGGGGTKKRRHTDQLTDDDHVGNAIAELHVIVNGQCAQIDELRATVHRQQECINTLMSMLGVPSATASGTHVQAPLSSSAVQPGSSSGASSSSSAAASAAAPPAHTYAGTVRDVPALSAPLRQAVVTAVYRDVKEHERRARNIVLNGVPPADGRDDTQIVSALFGREFGTKPEIIKCRRFGKPQPAKVQPLLVVLRDETAADFYANRAKQLRQSSDERTRRFVFINRDATKAEAQAAYVARCERRQRAADRANRMPGVASGHTASCPPNTNQAASTSTGVSMMSVDPPSSSSAAASVATAGQAAAVTSVCV